MRCGAKCFLVEIEKHGSFETLAVNARTQIDARKVIRKEYGKDVEILSAVEEKANRNTGGSLI